MPPVVYVNIEEGFAGVWFVVVAFPRSALGGLYADSVGVYLRTGVASCGRYYAVGLPLVLVLLVNGFVEAADVFGCQCDGLISRGVEFQGLVSPVERPAVYAEGCGRWKLSH